MTELKARRQVLEWYEKFRNVGSAYMNARSEKWVLHCLSGAGLPTLRARSERHFAMCFLRGQDPWGVAAGPDFVPARGCPGPSEILDAVSAAFQIERDTILSRCRRKRVVNARQTAMLLMRDLSGMTHKQISKACGLVNHATSLHGCRAIRDKMERNGLLRGTVESLKIELGVAHE